MSALVLLVLLQVDPPALMNVNTATKAELMTIEGITPMVADNIIRDRPYSSVEDLEAGVPRLLFEKVKSRLTVGSRSAPAAARAPVGTVGARREVQVIQGNRIRVQQFQARPQEPASELPAEKPR